MFTGYNAKNIIASKLEKGHKTLHSPDKFIPILSMTTTIAHAIYTKGRLTRIVSIDGKFFKMSVITNKFETTTNKSSIAT